MNELANCYEVKRDVIVLDAVHAGTMLRGGKTIAASMFPEQQQAIDSLVQQERLKAKIEFIDHFLNEWYSGKDGLEITHDDYLGNDLLSKRAKFQEQLNELQEGSNEY